MAVDPEDSWLRAEASLRQLIVLEPPPSAAGFRLASTLRPLPTCFLYAFIHTYKPVLEDGLFRSSTRPLTTAWCEENLPDCLDRKRAAVRRILSLYRVCGRFASIGCDSTIAPDTCSPSGSALGRIAAI
jgi:hypothetical protein